MYAETIPMCKLEDEIYYIFVIYECAVGCERPAKLSLTTVNKEIFFDHEHILDERPSKFVA